MPSSTTQDFYQASSAISSNRKSGTSLTEDASELKKNEPALAVAVTCRCSTTAVGHFGEIIGKYKDKNKNWRK